VLTVVDTVGRQIDRSVADERGEFWLPAVGAGTFLLVCGWRGLPVAVLTDVSSHGTRRDVELGAPPQRATAHLADTKS
jgi:hypothetical protein